RFGTAAVSLDRRAREVELVDGQRLGYQTVVLATGASPRQLSLPGADLGGVLTLRRIADSNAIKQALTSKAQIVIIGGGWIGLEVAAAARGADCAVTVVEKADLPLLGVLGPELAGYFA